MKTGSKIALTSSKGLHIETVSLKGYESVKLLYYRREILKALCFDEKDCKGRINPWFSFLDCCFKLYELAHVVLIQNSMDDLSESQEKLVEEDKKKAVVLQTFTNDRNGHLELMRSEQKRFGELWWICIGSPECACYVHHYMQHLDYWWDRTDGLLRFLQQQDVESMGSLVRVMTTNFGGGRVKESNDPRSSAIGMRILKLLQRKYMNYGH